MTEFKYPPYSQFMKFFFFSKTSQISVGQPHPALGLKPLNNDRSLGLPRESIVNFSHPSLCHQYNTIGKPQTEPCRYTSYIHQYVKKPSILAYIDMSRHISLYSEPDFTCPYLICLDLICPNLTCPDLTCPHLR